MQAHATDPPHGLGWTLVDPSEAGCYEAAVVDGRIPTRERSWHDTFNILRTRSR